MMTIKKTKKTDFIRRFCFFLNFSKVDLLFTQIGTRKCNQSHLHTNGRVRLPAIRALQMCQMLHIRSSVHTCFFCCFKNEEVIFYLSKKTADSFY